VVVRTDSQNRERAHCLSVPARARRDAARRSRRRGAFDEGPPNMS
jgi:hypothetical protein